MSSYSPPDPYVIIPFNSQFYSESSTGNISLSYANATYYLKTGGIVNGLILATGDITTQAYLTVPLSKFIIGSTTVLTSGTELNYLSGITLGTVTASKVLTVDSSSNIATINSLTTNTLICNTQFNNLGNATYSGVNSTILFSGNSTLINMTGSASRITLSGANSDIYLSGNNAHIDLLNTAASNNINTGTIRSAGGAFFGNDCIFDTQIKIGSSILNTTNAGYLVGISPGTVAASQCIVVDVNKDISNFRNLTATNLTGTLQTAAQTNITSLGTLTSTLLTLNTVACGLGLESSNANQISGATVTSLYDLYIKRNTFSSGDTTGIAFLATNNAANATLPSASIVVSRVTLTSGNLIINTTQVERLRVGSTGIITLSNATASTSNSLGALLLSGGISTSLTTDAVSSTNGGTFTSAGGGSFAKSLYVGTTLNTGGALTVNVSDTNNLTVVNTANFNHLLTSGTAGIGIGSGVSFNAPNASGSLISYGKIESVADSAVAGTHRGHMDLYTVYNASYVKAVSLSSTGSTTTQLLVNGTGTLAATYCSLSNNLAIDNSLVPSIQLTSTNADGLSRILLITDTQTWTFACDGSNGANYTAANSFVIYNAAKLLTMSNIGITKILCATDATTTATGCLILSGGLGIAKAAYIGGITNCTNTTESTSNTTGSLVVSGGLAVAKNMNIGVLGTTARVNIGTIESTVGYGPSSNLMINCAGNNAIKMVYNNSTGTETIYTTLGCGSGGYSNLVAYNTGTYGTMQFNNTGYVSFVSGLALTPRYNIDLGNVSADVKVCLYQSGASGTYGIGANNSAMQYLSGGTHLFYNSTTNAGLTTLYATISASGVISPNGVHSYGIDNTLLSGYGSGAHMHYAASTASFFGYNYNTSAYTDMSMNNTIIIKSTGKVGVGTSAPGTNFVVNYADSTQNTNSLWTIASDKRLKEEIIEADLQICYDNIKNIKLKRFKWKDDVYTDEEKNNDNYKVGFIADDIEVLYPKAINRVKFKDMDDCKTMSINDHFMALFGTVQLLQKKIEEQDIIIQNLVSVLTPGAKRNFNNL